MSNTSNKKAGNGNGNSVINNTEKARNSVRDDSSTSASKNKSGENTHKSNSVK